MSEKSQTFEIYERSTEHAQRVVFEDVGEFLCSPCTDVHGYILCDIECHPPNNSGYPGEDKDGGETQELYRKLQFKCHCSKPRKLRKLRKLSFSCHCRGRDFFLLVGQEVQNWSR